MKNIREKEERSGHWFFSAFRKSKWIYVQVMIAAMVSNFLSLTTALFTMTVYDRIIPNSAVDSYWSAGIFNGDGKDYSPAFGVPGTFVSHFLCHFQNLLPLQYLLIVHEVSFQHHSFANENHLDKKKFIKFQKKLD